MLEKPAASSPAQGLGDSVGGLAEFVAQMEEVLDLYTQPFDAKRPLVCMDERPMQLLKETRGPLPAKPGSPAKYDYEYERGGTAAHFLFTEPLAGWR